jgi:two-component system cell cycle sensor histidine kinase/response regulator CckA
MKGKNRADKRNERIVQQIPKNAMQDITATEKNEQNSGEMQFHELFNTMPDAVIILDRKGVLLEASEMAEKISGYRKSELIGRNILTSLGLLDIKTKLFCLKKLAQQFAGIKHPPFDIEIHTKDGRTVPIEINPQLISFRGKKADLIVLRDISERKGAEKRYDAIIRTSIDGFCITDIGGLILDANDSYCRLMGYSHDELLKMKISDFEAKESPEETTRRIRKVMSKGGDRFETQQKRKDGRIIDFEVSANYVNQDGGMMFIFIRDITERKKAEEELKKLNLSLESKVEELGKLNKLAVGRELKMIELKKRIRELETERSKN